MKRSGGAFPRPARRLLCILFVCVCVLERVKKKSNIILPSRSSSLSQPSRHAKHTHTRELAHADRLSLLLLFIIRIHICLIRVCVRVCVWPILRRLAIFFFTRLFRGPTLMVLMRAMYCECTLCIYADHLYIILLS